MAVISKGRSNDNDHFSPLFSQQFDHLVLQKYTVRYDNQWSRLPVPVYSGAVRNGGIWGEGSNRGGGRTREEKRGEE